MKRDSAMKRSVLSTLSLFMILALLITGCAAPAAPVAQPAGEAVETAAEKVSLTIFRNGDSWDPDNAYLPMIKEAVNMELDFQEIPSPDYIEKRNVVMASGDYPNIIQVAVTDPAFLQYYEDGLLQPLDEWIEKYPVIRDSFAPDVWEALRQADGKIYSIPRIAGIFPQTLNYRRDWADALNIEQPQTLDEFRAMLVAFKENDPGGVGDQLIPFVPNRLSGGGALTWVEPIFSAFGVPWGGWLPDPRNPDTLVYAATLPATKDALLYLRGLLADGLMDETYLVSTERGLFKYYAGITGATTDWPQFINLRREAIENAWPDAEPKLNYITGLIGPDGVQGGSMVTPDVRGGAANMSVTIDTTPEQVDGFFRLMEWQWTDGWDLMTLGVEGKSYDVVDGSPVRRGRDSVLENDPKYDLYMLDRLWTVEPPRGFAVRSDTPSFSGIPADEMAYVKSVLEDVVLNRIVLNYAVNTSDPVIADNITDITSLAEEFASKVILNPDLDADAEYEAFLAALDQVNMAEVTAKINELNDIEAINRTAKAMVDNFLQAMEE
jgi:putative aldouronate transport system substrate-binding protein